MKKFKTKSIEQQVVVDITCDCCGESCNTDYGPEYMTLSASWGFMSDKDLETWEAHLCEGCVDKKLAFIKFKKTSSIGGREL